MSPKFKGREDDWLDNEKFSHKSAKARSAKKKITERSAELELDQANATVVEVFPKQSRVRLDADGVEMLCSYRRAQVYQQGEIRERSPVAVGDRIKVQVMSPQSGVIEGRCKRTNQLARPAPDREEKSIHVLAANIDYVVIVTSVAQPGFSVGIVDRFLAAAYLEKITPIVVVNKIDLLDPSIQNKAWDCYSQIGIPVLTMSCKENQGVFELREKISGKTAVFCGHSGVGKSSLLSRLIERQVAVTGEVNTYTGKGKHTTTSAVMIEASAGSRWIDTPGVKEFGLLGFAPEEIAQAYPEFASLACTQKGCIHMEEASCDALMLPRYESYRRIVQSLIDGV